MEDLVTDDCICGDCAGCGSACWKGGPCADNPDPEGGCGDAVDECSDASILLAVFVPPIGRTLHLLSPDRWLRRLALAPESTVPSPVRTRSWPRRWGMWTIRGYQRWLSPRLPTRCRYVPTCSAYGMQAVRAYGLIRGSRVALERLLRCTSDVPRGTPDPLLPR